MKFWSLRLSCSGIFFCAILFLLGSCAVGPNFTRPPVPKLSTYPSKQLGSKTVATSTRLGKAQSFVVNKDIPTQWWTLFHSKPLNDLITETLQHNPNMDAAKAALRASLESVYAQKGSFYPNVGLGFSPTLQQTAGVLQSNLANNQYNYALYTGQIFVTYTLDLFGGMRRKSESLIALSEFQRFQLEGTYVTLTSNVVYSAIQEASLREQIAATKQIIALQKKMVAAFEHRQQLGDASIGDVSLQEAQLAVAQATLPPLELQWLQQRNLLNALTGRFPDDPRTPSFRLNELQLPESLPLSLPSTLLEHRPDIRAAEAQMHAANALIGVAVSNRLPNVTLGITSVGTTALQLSGLLGPNASFWGLAGLITQPIFNAGTLRHRQREAEATYQQAAALYRITVINAFQNLSDTLKAIKQDARALHAADKAFKATEKNYTISRRQLAAGDVSSFSLLLTEQMVLQTQLSLIQAKANRLSDTVALFQALGGGWWCK